LVVVAVPTAEAARRIFTVLNARGLDLTPTDILKANLLERGSLHEASLAGRWESIEQSLGRDKMVELFGHIRMMFEREKPRLSLEVGFQKFVQPFGGDAETFLTDLLEPIADALLLLGDIARIKKFYGAEAAKAVVSLQRIDNKDWVPPALLRIWRAKKEDAAKVADFLNGLERVAYYLFVTRQGINARIERFALIMDQFQPRKDTAVQKQGLDLSPQEQRRFGEALAGPLYATVRVCKPVLQRLDEALSSGGATYDDLVSIEHVLPQTVEPASEWASLFPEEVDRVQWIHRIANLVFLTQRINSRASNWDFEKKKKEYFASQDGSSPFVITQGVLQTEKWTPEHLADRQRKLLSKLADVWNLKHWDLSTIELHAAGPGFEDADDETDTASLGVTDRELIEQKRQKIMAALADREGVKLVKDGAVYKSEDGTVRAVCTVSKRYGPGRAPYWYGYSVPWRKFLLEGPKKSFFVLGCMDRSQAYAIPTSEMEKALGGLHRTPEKHWHIALEENALGGLDIALRSGAKIELKQFELIF
jgi:hypothetical protein